MSREDLEAILRRDCESDVGLGFDVVFPVMEELARRDGKRTGEEAKAAWEMFMRYYLPVSATQDLTDPETGLILQPSWHGEHCPGNGEHPGVECCCDECDHYLACFPEAEPKILRNRARCRKCGSILESRSAHDLQTCSCGAISIDGGLDYLRRLGEPEDIEDLSEVVKPIWGESEQRWI